jgi:thioredoxin 1
MKEWKEEAILKKLKREEDFCLYLFTPICGTCQVASKMLTVAKELLPNIDLGKSDINYTRAIAEEFEVESVPCLLIFKNGFISQKIYAFQSVPYLLDTIKNNQ